MGKNKVSGVAIFMYSVIALSAVIAAVNFGLYYGNVTGSGTVLWIGIVFFMIVYHLWLRLIMGNITKLFKICYKQAWFKERFFEKKQNEKSVK